MNNNNSLETKTFAVAQELVFIDLTNYFQWKLQVVDVVGEGELNIYTDQYDTNSLFMVQPLLNPTGTNFEMEGYAKDPSMQTHIWVSMTLAGTASVNVIGSLRRG